MHSNVLKVDETAKFVLVAEIRCYPENVELEHQEKSEDNNQSSFVCET